MTSQYPGALDQLAVNKIDATAKLGDHAQHHNAVAAAVNAVQQTIGVDPALPDQARGVALALRPWPEAAYIAPGGRMVCADDRIPAGGGWRSLAEWIVQVGAPTDSDVPREALVYIHVDDEATPTVDGVPLAEFFGDYRGNATDEFLSDWIGTPVKADGGKSFSFFRRWPQGVPYQRALRIEIENPASASENLTVWSQCQSVALRDTPRRHWYFQRVADAAVAWFDWTTLLNVSGAGELQAVMLSVKSDEALSYLEGNFRGAFDGAPGVRASGTEDFFNHGFYAGVTRHVGADDFIVPVVQNGPTDFLWTALRRLHPGQYGWQQSADLLWQAGQPGQGTPGSDPLDVHAWVAYYLTAARTPGAAPAAGAVLFSDEFDRTADPLGNGWLTAGSDSWQDAGGHAWMPDQTATDAIAWRPDVRADVRVEAQVELVTDGGAGEVFIFAHGDPAPTDPWMGNRYSLFSSENALSGAVRVREGWTDLWGTAEDVEVAPGRKLWLALECEAPPAIGAASARRGAEGEAAACPCRAFRCLRRPQAPSPAAPRGHPCRTLHGGAADAGVESLRRGAWEGETDNRGSRERPQAGGPGGTRLPCGHPQPALGGRPHLRAHPLGLRLRCLHHRRLLTLHRRLAGLALAAYRARARRPRAGAVGAERTLRWADPSQ